MRRSQRSELLLFIACFFAYAFFHQGGGWNQNARFAEVRAIVEQGRFAIDDYLIYKRSASGDDLERLPVKDAEYEHEGKRFRLCWVDMEWNLFPVGDKPLLPGVEKAPLVSACASGDIGYVPATGHMHPNKPPGTSLLAAPGYFLIYHVERLLGWNPDHWWLLDLNLWLTGVLSVGLISAIGCVLFFRLARDFAGGAEGPALLATIAFAFGTTFFPFGTLLFDHNLTASLLVAAFYCLWLAGKKSGREQAFLCFGAGICGGLAVLTNYVAIGGVAILGGYALLARFSGQPPAGGRFAWRRAIAFSLGGIGPALVLCGYGWVCYGAPLKPSTDFQNPLFRDTTAFLGMFYLPHSLADFGRLFYVSLLLSISPFRGVFWFCPVLALGLVGGIHWLRRGALRAEGAVCLAIFFWFFGVNAMFNGYHAGFAAGPRYIVPGMPFLALPLVVAFVFLPRVTGALALVSVASNLLLTATDAQNPVGIGGHTRIEGRRDEWRYNLIGDYAWPLFASGRAWPLLHEQIAVELEKARVRIANDGGTPEERARREEEMRLGLLEGIQNARPSPFLLGSVEGPVSVNPIAPYEGLFEYGFFPPGSPQCRWASFNVGEFLWPQTRWSLLPLILVSGGLCAYAVSRAMRSDAAGAMSEPGSRAQDRLN